MIAARWSDDGHGEGAPKGACRVAFGAGGCNGETKYLSNSAAKFFCSLLPPARLYRTKDRKNFRRGYFGDRSRANARPRKPQEPLEFCDGTVGLTLSPLLFQKLSGDGVEGVGSMPPPF